MSHKCKFCHSPLTDGQSICSVCKIDNQKDKKQLSKEEKNIANNCRALRMLGILTVIGGSVVIFGSIPNLLTSLGRDNSLDGCLFSLFLLFLGAFYLFYGICLMSYAQWCYIGGIILSSVSIWGFLLEPHRTVGMGALWGVLLLGYILASRKIFYRKL